MAIPTNTTLHAGWKALATAVNVGPLAGKVSFAWPGPAAKGAKELAWVDDVVDFSQQIVGMKAGRKMREEFYTLELVLWVTRPQGNNQPAAAEQCLLRALELQAVIEDALADDVQLGETGIEKLELADWEITFPVPVEQSWGCQIVSAVDVEALLS